MVYPVHDHAVWRWMSRLNDEKVTKGDIQRYWEEGVEVSIIDKEERDARMHLEKNVILVVDRDGFIKTVLNANEEELKFREGRVRCLECRNQCHRTGRCPNCGSDKYKIVRQ